MGAGEQYDVAVVGYGPTGVTAANLLGGMGLRVVVIERDTDIYTRARAISTDEEVMRIWQSIGLADQLKRDVLAGLPLQFVDQNGAAIFEALPTCYGSGHPAQMFIYQPALEAELRIGVERYPNVEVLLGHECLKVCQGPDDPAGVELTVVETGGDRVTRLRATYVIASDGGSSGMRAQLNVGYQGRTYEDRWVVIDTKMLKPWPHHDELRFHCDPKRPAVDCPTPLEHHRWEFPVLPGEDERYLVTDEAIWELLARYGIDSSHVKILRGVVYSHHVRLAARWRVGRVFLAGDAAHAMPPWIGQGMAAGVRDAANLCWKLAAVLKGELPDAVLDSYQDERLPHVREVTKRAVFVGRIITERRSAVATLRDPLVRAVTRVPGLSSHFQKSNWVPEPHYPTGSWPAPAAPPSVAGSPSRRSLTRPASGCRWTTLWTGAGSCCARRTARCRRPGPTRGWRWSRCAATGLRERARCSTPAASCGPGCGRGGRTSSRCARTDSSTPPAATAGRCRRHPLG